LKEDLKNIRCSADKRCKEECQSCSCLTILGLSAAEGRARKATAP
jgi:hypothetical protein